MTVPAGWYPSHDGSIRMQWWDGSAWTENFAEPQGADLQLFKPNSETPQPSNGATASDLPEPPDPKVNFFNASKVAKQQLAENKRLHALVEKHGLLEVAQIDAVKASYERQIAGLAEELKAVDSLISARRKELLDLESSILDARAAIDLQDFGLYDYEHPAESSISLGTQLEAVRSEIKSMIQQRQATTASTGFTFNNSTAKGNKFIKDMSSILLRAYNAEAENCIKSVKAGNLSTAQARLGRVKEQIARQGSMIELKLTERFHALRLSELELAARHLQALRAEKELERERRAQLAEQRKAEAELRREQERLGKERSHYLATLAALEAQGDLEGVERMRDRLAEVDRAIADVDYRAANIRAGYVYVISNIGAFGEEMVKIGMTRRLEPMDRVNELGDASVPFRFDVHALFFADDAVGVEAMLHQTFAEQRVNKVNLRREFFRATPGQVLEALREHAVEILEFKEAAEAPEYRVSVLAQPGTV